MVGLVTQLKRSGGEDDLPGVEPPPSSLEWGFGGCVRTLTPRACAHPISATREVIPPPPIDTRLITDRDED